MKKHKMETTTLYRPVNKAELDIIQESGWKKFPSRLPEQPIFYPVTTQEYASQITTEWNLPSYKNGFVTAFKLSNEYLSKFNVERVGLDHHTELWVPAEKLEEFNSEIIDQIKVVEAYDSNPKNQYIYVTDTFKIRNENVIAFEFINKQSDFQLTKNSKIEEFKLKDYLDLPRKVKPNGQIDLETYLIVLEDNFKVNPIMNDRIYLLISNSID